MRQSYTIPRWNGHVKADDIPELKKAVELMADRQLSFYATAFKAFAPPEARQVVLDEISRRCVLAYVEEGLGG
jgi:hypothetical protein